MTYYLYSAFDWFRVEAPNDKTIIAVCALLGDCIGATDEAERPIKPPFSGNRWYNTTLHTNKAKLLDSISYTDIQTCLLSFQPVTDSTMSKLIISQAIEMAKGLEL